MPNMFLGNNILLRCAFLLGGLLYFQHAKFHCVNAEEPNVYEIKYNGRGTPYLTVWIVNGHVKKPDTEMERLPGESINHLVGNFVVSAPPNHGIMSVIEILNLGKNNDDCADSIRFEQDLGPYKSPMICNSIGEEGLLSSPIYSHSSRDQKSFIDPKGKTRVLTDIHSENLPYIVAKILFTSYVECPQNLDDSTLARCSSNNDFSCIDRRLFCDLRPHCGFEDEFGLDEKKCHLENGFRYGFVALLAISSIVYLIYFAVKKLRDKINYYNRLTADQVQSECPVHNL